MAKIAVQKETKPTVIDKFLGLNISRIGDTSLKLGESGNMDNFYISDDYKLKKMYGYKSFYNFETPIRGLYSTRLGNIGYLLVATDGKLYYFLQDELEDDEALENIEPTLIGNIPNNDTSFFTFDKKIYILCGSYMSWDGTTLETVTGYTPLVFINTPAGSDGGGILYDEINMLNPQKHQTFNGDNSSTVFHIAQDNVDSIDKVLVNGNEVSNYTADLVNGLITFATAPSQGMDNVDIYWSKDDGDRGIIDGMKFGTLFGGDIDSRVFLYGNPTCQNRTYYSGIADGVPSVEYFPATAQVDIGPSNFALTDLTRQYDRLLATTNLPEAYYLTISTETLPVTLVDNTQTSRLVPSVSTFPLNEIHGNVAPGQGQLINNNPVTIDKTQIIEWVATNVRDEKNIQIISQKIDYDLQKLSMNLIKTLDFQIRNQLWIVEDNNIYLYNYFNKTFSRLTINDNILELTDLNNIVYMGCDDGKMCKWSEDYSTYDGNTIKAHWEMNFENFGAPYLRKTMNRMWVLMQPQTNSSAKISYVSNRNQSLTQKYIKYKVQAFDNVDFSDFSFQISVNPQPFRLKLKAKKFTNLKAVIENDEDTSCTVLQLILKVETFGESK